MKIAYFGSDIFRDCLRTLVDDPNHDVVALYTGERSEEEQTFTRHVRAMANTHNIPIIAGKPNTSTMTDLGEQGCEMVLCAGYSHKIPDWRCGTIRYGMNIHPSLLPQGGGPMSIPLAIYKGLKKTGVTLHHLAPDWDTGDIIIQESFPIHDHDNADSLLRHARELGQKLLCEFLKNPDGLWSGATSQNKDDVDYWPMPDADIFANDYTENMDAVRRKLRVHHFINPDGHVEYMDEIVLTKNEHNHPAGTVVERGEDNRFTVAVKDGFVQFQVKIYMDNVVQ